MEVRPGDPSGGADEADLLALAEVLAGRDVDAREMRVAGLQPVAVIDQDGVPVRKSSAAKRTTPPAAATIGEPAGAAMSTPYAARAARRSRCAGCHRRR